MTTATLSKPSYRWRVVDIVVAAVVAVACAVVFVGWNIGSHVLDGLQAALPGLQAIGYGPWLLGGILPSHAAPPPFAHISNTAWIALAISGVACTATTTLLWNWGIHHVPASRAGVFLNIEPALGSILGVKLLGEHLGPYAWAGGALILGAAIVLTMRGHEPQPEIVLE